MNGPVDGSNRPSTSDCANASKRNNDEDRPSVCTPPQKKKQKSSEKKQESSENTDIVGEYKRELAEMSSDKNDLMTIEFLITCHEKKKELEKTVENNLRQLREWKRLKCELATSSKAMEEVNCRLKQERRRLFFEHSLECKLLDQKYELEEKILKVRSEMTSICPATTTTTTTTGDVRSNEEENEERCVQRPIFGDIYNNTEYFCCVCYENVHGRHLVFSSKCPHNFCKDCLMRDYRKPFECFICKRPMDYVYVLHSSGELFRIVRQSTTAPWRYLDLADVYPEYQQKRY